MTIKVTRIPARSIGTRFSDLEIGEFFRYLDPSDDINLYVKTNYGQSANTLHINKGNGYPTRRDAQVVKQDVLITVSDHNE